MAALKNQLPGLTTLALVIAALVGCAPDRTHQRPAAGSASARVTDWVDPSPHRSTMVEVEKGVRLEVLDWGGSGRPLVLITGLGNTAHVYDDFAPKLARDHHVFGITRRGFGSSSVPDAGYDADRLADDIAAVLDQLKLEAPVLVGHSIASEEFNAFAARHPTRAAALIYLDAAYDRTDPAGREPMQDLGKAVPPPDGPTPADLASYQAFTQWYEKARGVRLPETELRMCCEWESDGRPKSLRAPAAANAKITATLRKPDYARIRVPALSIYAPLTSAKDLPDYRPQFDAAYQAMFEARDRFVKAQIELFRTSVARGKVVSIPGADHYVFLSNEAEVLREIDAFIKEAVH